ncbi:nicotinic acid mononucleotide adenyltransferase [Zeaxanthinibacter sp. PT1]|uniref:toxin-antitoxin system YwqK family antitoxin n=1 Tax=Zeaxanthinibacter TaxID=561554 RepID=UPI0023497C7F|nr:nicotinic acid mononucleotide adenyltransferase [Zeaxanthinibacter sp. PT1]MDC6350401.1 nicotinic acid mononucleotide adenyltransferase [Zeaxanthinibacter sp. PT1]
MKKLIAFCAFCLVVNLGFSQKDKEIKVIKDKSLVEAVYYHDNGEISQMGTYNLKGELHGKWISYDESGNKRSIGTYENGVKTGKWFFWGQDKLREVDFDNNAIASVQEWNNATQLVIRD